MPKRVNVIGIGASGLDSLSSEAQSVIFSSDVIVGWERTLSLFRGVPIKQVCIDSSLSGIISIINSFTGKTVSVIASGDPNFFGIAEYLYSRVDRKRVKVFPNVSSMQLAFAAIKESMTAARIVSVHGRSLDTLCSALKESAKVGIFTDRKHSPQKIASFLLDRRVEDFEAYLCENMGCENESVRKLSLKALAGIRCSDLNILVLVRSKKSKFKNLPFGIPDEMFFTRNRMITKEEVRVVTLAKLGLLPDSVFWDIGSGSGSVSIEAGFIADRGQVYAVEKDSDAVNIIRKNTSKFLLNNITILNSMAPDGLEELPPPDSVFIGGSGGALKQIILYCFKRLKNGGRLVMNTLVLENLHEGVLAFKEAGAVPEVVQVAISKERDAGRIKILGSHNPVFIISSRKGG